MVNQEKKCESKANLLKRAHEELIKHSKETLICIAESNILKIPKQKIINLSKENMIKSIEEKLEKLPSENISEVVQDNFFKISQENLSKLRKFEEFLYSKPIIKIPLFLIGFFFLEILVRVFLKGNPLLVQSITVLIVFLTTWYIIFFVIYMIKKTLKSLFTAKNLLGLFISYVLFMISVIVLFSFMYSAVDTAQKGYLTYGQCSDKFEPGMVLKDSYRSTQNFYFSAITFFTIGYGDICPMGWAKTIAVINGFMGAFINTVVMVMVISTYLKRKEED
ncbi:MAG: potassium channel family protein [Candidatus Woesearchaeota archaeon]|jgi:potassium channel LctB